MARQAKIYFQDQLAGYLFEGDNGYSFYYDKDYLETPNPKPISLITPI
ncbi:HipA domain-containing protein [Myroides odoratimimus CCUG 3837]|nr:HipA domain-containing protein [Myroides odoratimimus CCUG 3837]